MTSRDERNKQFDALMRRDRIRLFLSQWKAALLLIAIAAFFLALAFDHPKRVGEYEATIVGVVQGQSDTPRPSRVVIEFDDGRRATIRQKPSFLPEIGRRIVVSKAVRDSMGIVHFKFVRYADTADAGGAD